MVQCYKIIAYIAFATPSIIKFLLALPKKWAYNGSLTTDNWQNHELGAEESQKDGIEMMWSNVSICTCMKWSKSNDKGIADEIA